MSISFGLPRYWPVSQKRPLQSQVKQEATTKNETAQRSSPELLEWSSQEDLLPRSSKVKALEQKISKVKIAQDSLEMKFSKVVEHLSMQIKQKQEDNKELQNEIAQLQDFLKQSRNDLQIIKNYLKKQYSKENYKENQRKTVNLSETLYKTKISKARDQIFTDITIQSTVRPRKSISPKMRLLKKQMKG